MTKNNSYEKLEIWDISIFIGTEILKLVNSNQNLRRNYSLADQIQRSAVSISSNIAEGSERQTNKEFVRFLYYAKGSAGELRSQLMLIRKAKIISKEICLDLEDKLLKLNKRIGGLIKYLKN